MPPCLEMVNSATGCLRSGLVRFTGYRRHDHPMIYSRHMIATAIVLVAAVSVDKAEHRVELLDEAPPSDVLTDDVLGQLAVTGLKVVRGTKRTICEIWLCKEWGVQADFKPNSGILYPFEPGQLIGVLRFRRKGGDFRDQDIGRGVYTLRYGRQPVDGNHEGTSPTRDFLLLVRAEDDTKTDRMDPEQLIKLSATAAESNHPALLCLQKVEDASESTPSIHHHEDNDWWVVRLSGAAKADNQTHDLVLALVVAGHADE